ncbi:MAG: sensor histidine kinase [Solirubrobacteraceae bacterium]
MSEMLRAEADRGAAGVRARLALALLAALVLCVTIATAREAGAREPDLAGFLLGATLAAPLLTRGWRPVAVLIAAALVLQLYYIAGYPAIGIAVPLALAAYTAAAAGHLWTAVVVTGVFEIVGVLYRTLEENESLIAVIGLGTVADVALLAAVILLAEVLRSRRALQAETRERLRVLERERELEAERRVEQERLRIARELHDILGHTIAVINVHAGVAVDVLSADPDQARVSLRAIREQTREAIAELKATVGVLRQDGAGPERAPAPTLAQLDDLAELARGAELGVEISIRGTRRPLSAPVELTAYRVAQESLTNVLRHAGAETAQIRLTYEPAALVVEVTDDGRGPANGSGADGHGIAGMRERVHALGGTLETGAAPGSGFRVTARLPTDGGGR